jgi:hypothetical protein
MLGTPSSIQRRIVILEFYSWIDLCVADHSKNQFSRPEQGSWWGDIEHLVRLTEGHVPRQMTTLRTSKKPQFPRFLSEEAAKQQRPSTKVSGAVIRLR